MAGDRKLQTIIRRPKSRPVLGLDISTSSVKLVELRKAGSSYRVTHFAVEPMPANAIADKLVTDIEAVGGAVRRAWKRSGSHLKNAAIAIGGSAVITKTLTIPAGLSERECEEQVSLAAQHIIPFSMDDVAWDFDLVGSAEGEEGMQEALLVVTRRENVEHRQAVLELAGLKAEVVDCESFALESAFSLLDGAGGDAAESGRVVALVDFGAATTTLSVFHDGRIVYIRDQAFGGSELTAEIMRHYSLSYEDAGRGKRRGGLPDGYETEVLGPFMQRMAAEAGQALQFFYAATSGYDSVDRALLCGGCAAIPGVAEVVGQYLNVPVGLADPLTSLSLSARARAGGIERDAPALMVACGLALRSFG